MNIAANGKVILNLQGKNPADNRIRIIRSLDAINVSCTEILEYGLDMLDGDKEFTCCQIIRDKDGRVTADGDRIAYTTITVPLLEEATL